MSGHIEGRPINRGDLAALCGVSLPTVDGWVEKGCPFLERGSRGVEWRFDSAAVIDWRIQRAVESAVMNAGEDSSNVRVSADNVVTVQLVTSIAISAGQPIAWMIEALR